MYLLQIENLCKKYEKFQLKNVSFKLESGYIMGFIGRNGAGKTTTLKSMLGIVHSDGGNVEICGMDFAENELKCKEKIGLVLGDSSIYPKSKLKSIANVTKHFYKNWDDDEYYRYLDRFELDENKRISELSAGMKVKFSLALALSHHAQLLILDEPTSGLDPVSRDDLIKLFRDIIEDGEHSILFSTHIISDLEKCADYITYIKDGEIFLSADRDDFSERYKLISGKKEQLNPKLEEKIIGIRCYPYGFEGMIHSSDTAYADGCEVSTADFESIMVHLERKED